MIATYKIPTTGELIVLSNIAYLSAYNDGKRDGKEIIDYGFFEIVFSGGAVLTVRITDSICKAVYNEISAIISE